MSVTLVEPQKVETSEVTTRDVPLRAADLLEEFGWCQHEYAEDEEGFAVSFRDPRAVRFCLLGALSRACLDLGVIEDIVDGYAPLRVLLNLEDHPDAQWRWNDDPTRTKEEVVSALREAAERA